MLGVPTFGWAEGRYFLVKSGSGAEIARYLEARPEHAEDVMLVLRYFDAMNFAGLVSCRTLIGLGLHDPVVPPETVYSIANHFSAPIEIMEFPVSHTALPEEKRWEQFEVRWLSIGLGEAELCPSERRDKPHAARADHARGLTFLMLFIEDQAVHPPPRLARLLGGCNFAFRYIGDVTMR